jgi:hypothetical protein
LLRPRNPTIRCDRGYTGHVADIADPALVTRTGRRLCIAAAA